MCPTLRLNMWPRPACASVVFFCTKTAITFATVLRSTSRCHQSIQLEILHRFMYICVLGREVSHSMLIWGCSLAPWELWIAPIDWPCTEFIETGDSPMKFDDKFGNFCFHILMYIGQCEISSWIDWCYLELSGSKGTASNRCFCVFLNLLLRFEAVPLLYERSKYHQSIRVEILHQNRYTHMSGISKPKWKTKKTSFDKVPLRFGSSR